MGNPMGTGPDGWRMPWLEDVARDVRFGLRSLKRSPGFTATAILSLALGIGANTGIFSLVDQVLLRLLPVDEPERIVLLRWRGNALSSQFGVGDLMSYPLCLDLHRQGSFDGVFCRASWQVNFSTGAQHEVEPVEIVSGSYFPVLGVRPALGRLIDESDDVRPGEHPVVVLSHAYWQNRLGGARDVVGRGVLVNNLPMTVIGVAAAGFHGMDIGDAPSLWVPAAMTSETILEFDGLLNRRSAFMQVFARSKPGSTADGTQAALQSWFASVLESDTRVEGFPQTTPAQLQEFLASRIEVLPGAQGWSQARPALTRPLLVLMTGTTLLVLLACLNVASLLLARGAERTRELTTRMALGATRARITRQLLVEVLLVALAGGALGLAVAPLVIRVLLAFLPVALPPPPMDARIFLFALLVSLAAAAVCALAPAVQAARRSLISSMNRRDGVAAGGTVRIRKAIVITQLAFTILLLVGAGLFAQTLAHLQARDRGFDSARLVVFRADAAAMGYSEEDAARVMRDLRRTLEAQPGVERAAVSNRSLLTGASSTRVLTVDAGSGPVVAPVTWMRVSPGFFSTVGTRIVDGRDFDGRDTRGIEETGFHSIIVNETFARRYFGSRGAVGQRVGNGNRPDIPLDVEIVGVVNDFAQQVLGEDDRPAQAFIPFADEGELAGDGAILLRIRGDPESAFASIRAAVGAVDPRLPLIDLRTLDAQVDRVLQRERMLAVLSSGFGAIALLLSVVGLYGVMSFVVARRTREIGMRLALGATRLATIWLVMREAVTMIAVGIAVALPAAWALRRLVQSELFGVGAFDGPTIAAAGGALGMAALGATLLPAWRAAVLPPMTAIQDQPESIWQSARQTVQRRIHELVAGDERSAVPSVTLIDEFTGLVQRSDSFPEALRVALPALGERVGARFITLLEKTADDYRGDGLSIPARGVLVNRVTHYRHPLPLTAGDFQAWLQWAREIRPQHVAEIERLESTGARIAVPLRTRRGIVGILLLAPSGERQAFTGAEKQVLSSAAEVFALMIENARLNDRALEQEKVRRDLALAAEVQRRLLPPEPPASAAGTIAAFTMPARAIGGDFYDFVDLPDGRIGIALADIAGKGIAAALLTSVVQASLRVITSEGDIAPAPLASRMNRFLHRSTASNGYATFFYARLDPGTRRMQYVNAGHNPPYLVRRTAAGIEITELSVGGTVLGLFPEAEYEDAGLDIRTGDLFVTFTDGVPEARNPAGEEFGEERLKDLLRQSVGAPADAVSTMLAGRMRDWIAGAEQHDDLTVVVVSVDVMAAGV